MSDFKGLVDVAAMANLDSIDPKMAFLLGQVLSKIDGYAAHQQTIDGKLDAIGRGIDDGAMVRARMDDRLIKIEAAQAVTAIRLEDLRSAITLAGISRAAKWMKPIIALGTAFIAAYIAFKQLWKP